MDLASLTSVRTFAADLVARIEAGTLPPFPAVVCNAGVQAGASMTTTEDGYESTFGVNHLAHFLLVEQLRPVLTAPARVVVVASDAHDPASKAGVAVPAWSTAQELAHGTLGAAAATGQRSGDVTGGCVSVSAGHRVVGRWPASPEEFGHRGALSGGISAAFQGRQRCVPASIRCTRRGARSARAAGCSRKRARLRITA